MAETSLRARRKGIFADLVNTEENASLIYDFYGFPSHYYKVKYPNKGNKQLAEQIISLLRNHGIKASGTHRGLDHGIWVPFKVAFDPEDNPLTIPIVQGPPPLVFVLTNSEFIRQQFSTRPSQPRSSSLPPQGPKHNDHRWRYDSPQPPSLNAPPRLGCQTPRLPLHT